MQNSGWKCTRVAVLVLAVALSSGLAAQTKSSGGNMGRNNPRFAPGPAATGQPGKSFDPNSAAMRVDPFNRERHLPGPRSHGYGNFGRYGYGNYGGYGYGYYGYPYYDPYAYSTVTPYVLTPDASSQIRANGGTFNSPDHAWNNGDEYSNSGTATPTGYVNLAQPSQPPAAAAATSAEFEAQTRPAVQGVTSAANPDPAILVFRDGTRREIRNYAIYGGSVLVFNDQKTEHIPFARLELQSTLKANQEAGYDFKLPAVYMPR